MFRGARPYGVRLRCAAAAAPAAACGFVGRPARAADLEEVIRPTVEPQQLSGGKARADEIDDCLASGATGADDDDALALASNGADEGFGRLA